MVHAMAEDETRPREVCLVCRRPRVVCFCAELPRLPTRTRILILQHPRERRVGIGTGRMAHLALPGSVLRVDVDFSADPVVREILADGEVFVLFPGRGARPASALPRDRAVTLVVLDGTWSQARKLLRVNPALAALPRMALTPRGPSQYQIRRQPADVCLSTIEGLAEALDLLEPERGPFTPLLDPFLAMVARQQRYQADRASHRHHAAIAARQRRPRPPTLAARLAADEPRLVCVQGEANAWPLDHPEREPPELVHWVAHRPATGETYRCVVAPRRRLARSTPGYIGLDAATLAGGVSAAEWRRTWQAFVGPDDVLVHWGHFYTALAAAEGLPLPAQALDLRTEIARVLGRRPGTIAQCLPAPPPSLGVEGRAGHRLAGLVAVIRALAGGTFTSPGLDSSGKKPRP
jgi:DTW domain-containing protein